MPQEDYGEELNLVRRVNGPSTKFTRANYVQMILLSPIYPQAGHTNVKLYLPIQSTTCLQYAIDMRTRGGKRGGGYAGNNDGCCVIL